MSIQIFRSSDRKTSNWAGGTTTELFIFPENSSYQLRDFNFRVSTATVEVETSVFTSLAGTKRTLMVLDGQMTLKHEGYHQKTLHPFDSDVFEGGWVTRSEGKCTDFNLMTRNSTAGLLGTLSLDAGERSVVDPRQSSHFFIYVYSGELLFSLDDEQYLMGNGDLLKHSGAGAPISIQAEKESRAVLVFIA